MRQLVDGQGGARKYVAPDVCGAEHVSMNWAWALLEFVPRRVPRQERGLRRAILGWYLPLFSRRHIAAKAAVHVSVRDRAACAAIPPNLPADPVYES